MTGIDSQYLEVMGKSSKELEIIFQNFQKTLEKDYEAIFHEPYPKYQDIYEYFDTLCEEEKGLLEKIKLLFMLHRTLNKKGIVLHEGSNTKNF